MRARTIKYRCEEWGGAEILALLRGYTGNGAIDQLQRELEQQYRVPLYLLNSARAGLTIALNQCRKRHPERKTVLIPAYICNSIPQTITQMGLNVVSAPVNAQLNLCPQTLSPMLDKNCLAVVMPHMYGIPADVRTIRRLTRDAGIFLIDDAAQVAGIRVDSQLLGTFGDYGMLSFAQAKSIVCGVRGAGGVLFNTPRLREGAARFVAAMDRSLPKTGDPTRPETAIARRIELALSQASDTQPSKLVASGEWLEEAALLLLSLPIEGRAPYLGTFADSLGQLQQSLSDRSATARRAELVLLLQRVRTAPAR